PAVASRAAGETDGAYVARLLAADGGALVYRVEVEWTDVAGTGYGPIGAQTETSPALPVLELSLAAPHLPPPPHTPPSPPPPPHPGGGGGCGGGGEVPLAGRQPHPRSLGDPRRRGAGHPLGEPAGAAAGAARTERDRGLVSGTARRRRRRDPGRLGVDLLEG